MELFPPTTQTASTMHYMEYKDKRETESIVCCDKSKQFPAEIQIWSRLDWSIEELCQTCRTDNWWIKISWRTTLHTTQILLLYLLTGNTHVGTFRKNSKFNIRLGNKLALPYPYVQISCIGCGVVCQFWTRLNWSIISIWTESKLKVGQFPVKSYIFYFSRSEYSHAAVDTSHCYCSSESRGNQVCGTSVLGSMLCLRRCLTEYEDIGWTETDLGRAGHYCAGWCMKTDQSW